MDGWMDDRKSCLNLLFFFNKGLCSCIRSCINVINMNILEKIQQLLGFFFSTQQQNIGVFLQNNANLPSGFSLHHALLALTEPRDHVRCAMAHRQPFEPFCCFWRVSCLSYSFAAFSRAWLRVFPQAEGRKYICARAHRSPPY